MAACPCCRLPLFGTLLRVQSCGDCHRGTYALSWLCDAVTVTQALGSPETTAQVHPGHFTTATMRAAEAQGAELRHGRVSGIIKREGRKTGVEVDGAVIEGDAIVIAMGPWGRCSAPGRLTRMLAPQASA